MCVLRYAQSLHFLTFGHGATDLCMLDACISANAPQTFWTTYILSQHGAGNSTTACNGVPSKQVCAKSQKPQAKQKP